MGLLNILTGKKKTLVVILNYNLPEMTDALYTALKPYQKNDYDLAIIDNASEIEGRAKNTTHQMAENGFFGGGLNYAFDLILKNKHYDSLLFLNNDLVVHAPKFVSSLRKVMFEQNYHVVSPCVLQPEKQLDWRQMHNWGHTSPRTVKWVDFQAPLIHRDIIESIKQYSPQLEKGWGNDVYTGMLCEDNNWSIAVCDYIPVLHFHELTFKKGKSSIDMDTFRKTAGNNMKLFFDSIGESKRYNAYRHYGYNYKA